MLMISTAKILRFCCALWFYFFANFAALAAPSVDLMIDTTRPLGPIDLTKFALGQGGLSDKPMIDAHTEQLAQLHPQTIRIFVQEFFNLLPEAGRYHWATLDKSIEAILATHAKPIFCLCFKPKLLYPKIDQKIVHPNDYKKWEELIFELVKHCNQEKKFGIEYWEIGNEVDIGEDGGCPYLFQPDDYVTYYAHTAKAILRADKKAKIGGPALAGYNSDIGTVLIAACGRGIAPLDFFSWHVYSSEPEDFRKSIKTIRARLAKFPRLKNCETIIDEWNMLLDKPNLAPGFQPAFILETTAAFLDEGLSRAAYYHIRDSFVDEEQFAKFTSKSGAEFVAKWWNTMPQYDGLWDNQGQVRPAYSAFKLLSLLHGRRLEISGTGSEIKALATTNSGSINVVLWNFSREEKKEPTEISLRFSGIKNGQFRTYRFNPEAHLNPLELQQQGNAVDLEKEPLRDSLRPYEIRWITIGR